jgi:acetylornithine deacetylase/succinyl-diaminopimelate desuccinylase-like protein
VSAGSIFDAYWAKHSERFLDEWRDFLRFPSVSAAPAHEADCSACAQWLGRHLREIGFQAEVMPTVGKPLVFAERRGEAGAPVVLFYGHYDVQPEDPLELWQSPPFDPVVRDGRMYARGAEDNKGQVLFFLKALETLVRTDSLRATVRILIEGEEESGSRGIAAMIPALRDRLRADLLMVSDTSMAESGAGAIIMGLRGILSFSIRLRGPSHDLHSGLHGGVAPNPAQGIGRLIASLHRSDGLIAVEDFYRDVLEPREEEKRLAGDPPFDPAAYRAATGVDPLGGEPGFPPPERLGFRPSIDVNGVHSGFGGQGTKTIIPAEAIAKITARIVPNQDPAWCRDAILRHLRAQTPPGLSLDVEQASIGGPGFRLDPRAPALRRAKEILDGLTGKPTAYIWEGASVPVVAALWKQSGAQPLLVGFGREEDRIHAPNESFSIEQFRLGYRYCVEMLRGLAPA